MGKAKIIANLGSGLYTVEQDRGKTVVDAKILGLQSKLATVEQQITAVLNKRSQLDSKILQARLNFQLATEEYVAAVAGNPKASTTGWETAQKELLQLQALYDESTRELEKLRASKASIAKEITALQSLNLVSTFDAWCADYKDDATGEVATIEIPGEPQNTLIAPQAPAWTPAAGEVLAREAMTGPQAFFNAAILPGWQKFKPTYRRGVITSVDQVNSKANVSLFADPSSAQNLNVNQTDELVDVPIVYDCGASSFNIGDECVVQFLNQSWSNPQIIGFMSNPVSCGVGMFKAIPNFPPSTERVSQPTTFVDSLENVYVILLAEPRANQTVIDRSGAYLALFKYDKKGNVLLKKRLEPQIPNIYTSSGNQRIIPVSIKVNNTGIYIAARILYTTIYNYAPLGSANVYGPAVFKLDHNGNFVWGRDIVSLHNPWWNDANPQGSRLNIPLIDFDVNNQGEVALAAVINGQVLNTYEQVFVGGSSYREEKNLIHFANYSSSERNMVIYKIDSNGGLVTSTYFSDGTSFNRFQLRWIGMVNNSSQDSWLVVNGPRYGKVPSSIKFGENGNIYITGVEDYAGGMGQAYPPGGQFNEIPGGGHESSIDLTQPRESNLFFVMKMNPSASNIIWTKAYSGDLVPAENPGSSYTGISPNFKQIDFPSVGVDLEIDINNSKIYAIDRWYNGNGLDGYARMKNILFTLDMDSGNELSRKAYTVRYEGMSYIFSDPVYISSDSDSIRLCYKNTTAKLLKSDYTLYPSTADVYSDDYVPNSVNTTTFIGKGYKILNKNNYYTYDSGLRILYEGTRYFMPGVMRVRENNKKIHVTNDSMNTRIYTIKKPSPYPFVDIQETSDLSSVNNANLRVTSFVQYRGIESRSISFTISELTSPLIEAYTI